MSTIHPIVGQVTRRIRERSAESRAAYLEQVDAMAARPPGAQSMGCANVAHAFAGIPGRDRIRIVEEKAPNVGIVTAYNDVLSAHAPLAHYPDILKDEARRQGATAQVAGGVPAMCDGVTQGAPGMELSLFSRDAIAMGTAIALSHDVFDAALMLGICDKIVPGLLIGALHFGHLPTVFVPAGPMTSGLSNGDKAKVREQAAQGLVGRKELLAAESAAYHGEGTCTFYGTANSNQMLLEAMGLHVPGTAFINPADGERARPCAACWPSPRAGASRPSAMWWTSAASSMPWWPCWPRADRPTTSSTGWPWRVQRASPSTGTTSPNSRAWCRCWPASTPTAAPT
jgi:phosphogluconate dehydratase